MVNPATDLYRTPCANEVAYNDAAGLFAVFEIAGIDGSQRKEYARFATLVQATAAKDVLNGAGPIDRRYKAGTATMVGTAYRVSPPVEAAEGDGTATHALIRFYGRNHRGREVASRFNFASDATTAVLYYLQNDGGGGRRYEVLVL